MDATLTDRREPQLEADADFVAHPLGGGPVALAEVECEALELRAAFHDRRAAGRRERELDGDRLLHAADGQLALRAPARARAREARRVERGLRMLLDPEEVRAPQDLVALPVLRVDRGGLDGHVEPARLRMRGVEVDLDVKTLEDAREFRVGLRRGEFERARALVRLSRLGLRGWTEHEGEEDGEQAAHERPGSMRKMRPSRSTNWCLSAAATCNPASE